MFHSIHKTGLVAAAAAGVGVAQPGLAEVVPFTETFDSGSANFLAGDFSSATFDAVGLISVSIDTDTDPGMGLTVLRAEVNPGSNLLSASSGAFAGDYIEAGITQLTVDVRHDAEIALDLTARFSPINRFPGGFPLVGGTVQPGDGFTTLTFDIGSLSDVFFEGPSTPANFEAVFGNVSNIQLFLQTDVSGLDASSVKIEFDNFGIAVPEPTSLAMVGLGGVALLGRRRRK